MQPDTENAARERMQRAMKLLICLWNQLQQAPGDRWALQRLEEAANALRMAAAETELLMHDNRDGGPGAAAAVAFVEGYVHA